MSEKNTRAKPSANGKPAGAKKIAKETGNEKEAVIRRLEAAEETAQERLLKKYVPALVVSGAVHLVLAAGLFSYFAFFGGNAEAKPSSKVIETTAAKTEDEPEEKNLTNEDPGLDSPVEVALPEIDRLDKATADAKVTDDNVGLPDAPSLDTTALAPPGLGPTDYTAAGTAGDTGSLMSGNGGMQGAILAAFPGRSGATKSKLLKEGGGNSISEQAVALGLKWLASKQQANGGWVYDQGSKEEVTASTGMALLPFLAAGCTHKPSRDKNEENKYAKTVEAGLKFLMSRCPTSGPNAGRMSTNMYAQGIGTIALCEAYGMTKDPVLKTYAQAAINFIQKAQGKNGSWGYAAGANGDTSIVGWQVQALQAAKLSKDLVVDDRVIKNAIAFLNHAAAGSRKAMYGYADSTGAQPATAMTAVGLLCRYYLDGWGPNNPGMTEGVTGMMKGKPPVGKDGIKDMYYYYYATQVVHFCEGEDWKTWNEGPKQDDGSRKGGMRDWLISQQVKTDDAANAGSWAPESGWFGTSCGRLGTTAMCLLTLEVYYRHLPLYKRGGDAGVDKENVK